MIFQEWVKKVFGEKGFYIGKTYSTDVFYNWLKRTFPYHVKLEKKKEKEKENGKS